MADRYMIDSISLTKPYLLFEMKDSSNNFIELLPPEQPDTLAETNPDSSSIPLVYSINSFIIREGTIDFTDKTIKRAV